MRTKLTRKGYEIEKSELSSKDLDVLRNKLLVTPHRGTNVEYESFPVYQETKTKIIVPRYYGVEKYGTPNKKKIKGMKAEYEFLGNLRDVQKQIMERTMTYLSIHKGGILSVGCAVGKCLARGTKILMFNGEKKCVEEICVGDLLMGDDSKPRIVRSTTTGRELMYKITDKISGTNYTVNKSHILSLIDIDTKQIIDISVSDYLKHNRQDRLFGYRVSIEYSKNKIELDPYIIGYYYKNKTRMINCSEATLERIANKLENRTHNILHVGDSLYEISIEDKLITKSTEGILSRNYLVNNRNVRKSLLEGIIDNMGQINVYKTGYIIPNVDEVIIDLCRSLGYRVIKIGNTIEIDGMNIDELNLTNVEGIQNSNNNVLEYSIDLEELNEDQYYGFEIDGNRRFVLSDCTVTHNTVMALYYGSYLKGRMLVVTHKSFLTDQWIERAKQYTNAKIGLLRRDKIPDDDCEIVVTTIQSLCSRNYDKNILKRFKLVVYDECIPGNQYISTNSGDMKMDELYNKWNMGEIIPLVKSFNENNNTYEFKKMTYGWKRALNGKKIYKLICSNGEIRCTENHKIRTINGYIEASEIELKTLIMTENGLYKLISKEIIDDCEWVYDIEVEQNHNFVVKHEQNMNGILVHNCHHYGSRVYSRGFSMCGGEYTLGLSATPYRLDKLTKILYWNIGKIYYRQKLRTNNKVLCKVFNYKSHDKLFVEKFGIRNRCREPNHVKMIGNIVKIESRNRFLLKILNILRRSNDRKVLVLSGRLEHLNFLKNNVDNEILKDISKGLMEPGEYNTYYYIGGMKMKQRNEAEENADMLFGTYEMAHEGLDIDRLNTIVLASPKKDIIQSIGRILRRILVMGDLMPLIIDIADMLSIYKNHAERRMICYKKSEYIIDEYNVEDDKIIKLEDFLKKEYNMSDNEISEYIQINPGKLYDANIENILETQYIDEEGNYEKLKFEEVEIDEHNEKAYIDEYKKYEIEFMKEDENDKNPYANYAF